MPAMTPDASKADSSKRSKWNPFSKDKDKEKRKSAEIPNDGYGPKPIKLENNLLHPSGDSAYGSSEQSNSLTASEGAASATSLKPPNEFSGRRSATPTQATSPTKPRTEQPNHQVPVNGDLSHTSPTIKREVHDAGNGTQVTTVTTTTTTTTTVSGPKGTTTIEEPRAELGDGRATPQPPSQAVSNAIQQNSSDPNNTNSASNAMHDKTSGASSVDGPASQAQKTQRRRSLTPGQRPIPERDPSGLSPIGPSIRNPESQPAVPSYENPIVPPRSPHRTSWQGAPVQLQDEQQVPSRRPVPSQTPSQNYSYPRRTPPAAGHNPPSDLPQPLRSGAGPGQGSTLSNLKTAAAGIHGVAETLRGTLASEADRRLRPDKTSAEQHAKNQEIINHGRYEIESGRFATPRHSKEHPGLSPIPSVASRGSPAPGPGHQYDNQPNGYGQPQQPMQQPPQDRTSMDGYGQPQPQQYGGYRQPQSQAQAESSPQDSAHALGVDQNGNTVDGYAKPQWGHADADMHGAQHTSGRTKPGKLDKWLHKAGSYPPERSGNGKGDLKQERERGKLRRRSGQFSK